MRNDLILIPILTFFANIALLLNVTIFREIIFFVYLSFIPGFAVLRLFKLKKVSVLDTILFSVGLSIASVIFLGLLVNELYLFLNLSQPLSVIPLTTALSAFSLIVFLIVYKRDSPRTEQEKTNFESASKGFLPLLIILFFLPLLSALSVLYANVYALLISCALIATLCIMGISKRFVPRNLLPLLIFSISVALVCQVLLTSNYIVGSDANLEYSVFRLTQLNGHWGLLNANTNSIVTLNYNSMLSITLLPTIFSSLMFVNTGMIFKILYPFIFCLVPLALFRISEKQFGRLVGLLSALFFTFTSVAFFAPEPLSLNRQIVAEFFLLLSVFVLISKSIPVTKRRLLLIIFGAGLVVSHYSLAYIYLLIVSVVFVVSKVKPKIDDTINSVTLLLLFVITFSWYALATGPPFYSLAATVKGIFEGLLAGFTPTKETAASMASIPQVFTATTYINLLLTGISYLFLIIGTLVLVLRSRATTASAPFRVMLATAALILLASIVVPNIAITLNFSRFYAISLLFLAPCFVLGGQAILTAIGKIWVKITRVLKRQHISRGNTNRALLLIAIILGAYFLSQVGFVNKVGNGTIYFYSMYFNTLKSSDDSQVKIFLYGNYIPDQDVFSACWLQSYRVESAMVSADIISQSHVLSSYGLIQSDLFLSLTNETILPQGDFLYLSTLNIVDGVIPTNTGSFNASEIYSLVNQNDIVYSNGNSAIVYCDPI